MEHSPLGPLSPESVRLREAVDGLAALGCDARSIAELERERARLDAVLTKKLAEFEQWGEWAIEGAKTPVAWLDTHCHLPKSEARSQLRRGRALSHMALAGQAWAEGDIAGAHIDALERARRPRTEVAFARDEGLLVGYAKTMKFAQFLSVLAYWEQHADPDGAAESDLERKARRDVFLAQGIDAMWLGTMVLDPISGTVVANELGRLDRELYEADCAAAKKELGREPKLHELARTSAQRRADALVEMARRSRTAPADGRRPEPLFSVLIGYETLHGRIAQLANGPVISPDALFEWMDGARFERAVFAPGKRVEVSVTSRFFTGATRRAIELRDQECTHEYCDIPADACEIDHIVPFAHGGLTTQENGQVHCGYHNRLRNGRPPPGG